VARSREPGRGDRGRGPGHPYSARSRAAAYLTDWRPKGSTSLFTAAWSCFILAGMDGDGDWFHVSSSANRESIANHGLDWRRMGAARGIAGSRRPEQRGCFIARGVFEYRWFVRMNNTGGPVDVWQVHGIDAATLVTSPEGFLYFPGVISADRLTLVEESTTAT
jgi:hypothetical protein